MENIEYANAYSEVLEIIKFIPKEDYNKIPRKKIELFEIKANKDYEFFYNPEKTLDEQNVSKRAKAIIAILFRNYWATEIQKEKIIAKQKYDREQIEQQKSEKYNTDNLLKEKKIQNNNINISIIEYKPSFIEKIMIKIKKFFHNK